MKKGKLAVLAVAALGACCCFAAVGCSGKDDGDSHTHEYGNWTITQYPTADEGGKITRSCTANDGEVETLDIPALSDTSFWTVRTTPAGHTTAEQIVYSNSTYNISYEVDGEAASGHTWGEWTVKADAQPTAIVGGKIISTCTAGDGGEQTKDVPNLADETFWTVESYVEAGKSSAGLKVFVNAEYDVTYEVTIPALSDSAFWTEGQLTAPGHTTAGSQTYTNATYALSVTVTLGATGHTWGEWAFVDGEEATVDDGGKIFRECSDEDGGKDELAVPAFSDTSFWNKTAIQADYNTAGYEVYTPKDTQIEFEARIKTSDKLVAPYDNKTYYALAYQISGTRINRANVIDNTWSNAELALGGDNGNFGIGTGYPYNNEQITIEMVDASIGKIKLIVEGSSGTNEYNGYVNMDGDKPLIVFQDSRKDYFLLTPFAYEEILNIYDEDSGAITGTKTTYRGYYSGTADSSWSFADANGFTCKGLAVSYKYADGADKSVSFYLEEDAFGSFRVYFGAKFESKKDDSGSAIVASSAFNSSAVYIKDDGGELINAFGYIDGATRLLDGFEGVYSGTLNDGEGAITLTVNGIGGFTGKTGSRYTIAAAGSSYTLDAYIDGAYYEITLDSDGSFTAVKPMVTVTFNNGGETTTQEYNKNIEITISDLEGDGFIGWFFDAQFKNSVPSRYTPTENIEIFARWSTTYIEFYEDDAADAIKVYFNDGDILSTRIPESIVTLDLVNRRYIVGWYTAPNGQGIQVPNNAALYNEDSQTKLYAYWAALPAYYGARSGKQLLSGTTTNYTAEITIDESGKITGSIFTGEDNEKAVSGTITNYDEVTGRIAYSSGSTVGYMWFDAATGLLVIPYNLSETEIYINPFMLTLNGEAIVDNVTFGFHNGATSFVNRTMLVEYGNSGALALIYNDSVYGNVQITDAYGTPITTLSGATSAKSLVIKDSKGNDIVNFGTTADSFSTSKDELDETAVLKLLDRYYGVYTDSEYGEVKLDGLGKLTFDGKTADYKVESGDTFGVYVYTVKTSTSTVDDTTTTTKTKVNTEYYRLTLDTVNKTCSIEKIDVDLTFNVNLPDDATGVGVNVADSTVSVNANIIYALTKKFDIDAVGNYVFGGWYKDAACTEEVTAVEINADTVVYAKWLNKLTITLNINFDGADALDPVYIGSGQIADIQDPTLDDIFFLGWYTDAECTTAWDPTSPITDNIDLYAKWGAPAYMQTYDHYYIYGGSSSDTVNKDNRGSVTFDAQGYTNSGSKGYPFNTEIHQISAYDADEGTIIFTSTSSNNAITKGDHDGFIDAETGMIVFSKDLIGSDFKGQILLVPQNLGALSNYSESYWNNCLTIAITFTTANGGDYGVFVHKNVVYFNVTFTTADGTPVVGNACYTSPTLYVRDSNGTLIAKFGYDGTVMNDLDGYEDITYSGSLGDIVVDGVSTITVDGSTGSYSLAAASAGYTADVYVDDAYYEITLDKTNESYTAVKRMVTVNYSTNYDTANAVSGQVNKNIGITLPTLTDETHVFRGWYTDADLTDQVTLTDGKFVPTEEVTTLYAKWDIKVTLTVVYATITHDGITNMQNATKAYGANDALILDEFVPAFTNGKAFAGWYSDAACTTAFTGTAITADTTVYAKWIDAVAMYGTYYGWNLFDAGSKTINATSTSSTKLDIAADGSVTGTKTGNILRDDEHEYDPETGIFYIQSSSLLYYLVYDASSGAIGVAYSSSSSSSQAISTSFNEDMYLLFNKLIVSGANSASFGTGSLTGGKLVTLTFVDNTTVNLFVTNTRIYSGVTWTATDANGNITEYTAQNAGDASTITVYDSEARILIKRGKDGTTWKDLDGYEGAYSGSLGELTINGVGAVKLENVSATGSYTIAEASANYTADVYVDGKYYQVTLDRTNMSYTAVLPMATITFSTAHSTQDPVSANINIDYTLPTVDPVEVGDYKFKGWYDNPEFTGSAITKIKPTSTDTITIYARWIEKVEVVYDMGGHGSLANAKVFPEERFELPDATVVTADGWAFKGWYTNPEFTGSAVTYITPTVGNSVTLYAKWAEAVTLTLVCGQGNEDIVVEVVAGDPLNLSTYKPANSFVDGKAFVGWYTDVDCTQAANMTSISESTTLYAKWEEKSEYEVIENAGTYGFTYDDSMGAYKSSNYNVSSSTATMQINVWASGTLNIEWRVSSESGWDKFTINKNGVATDVYQQSGEKSGTLTLEVVTGDVITISYVKDSSGNSGDDRGYVNSIDFTAA